MAAPPPLLPPSTSSTTSTTATSLISNTNGNNNNGILPMLPLPPLQPLAPFNLSSINGEEISTIFVVGFPEDMLEREFQNMFIFSPGFEAATLKIPNKDQEDDMLANPGTTNTNETNDTNDGANGSGSSNILVPENNNDSNNDSNPSNSSKGTNHSSSNNNGNMRKQIIGFAKFRTRMEALEARDIISGRKVDAEKGSVLKAEMAKKNLHTKRGLSLEPLQQQQPQQQQHQQLQHGFPTQVLSPPINPSPYSNVLQQLAPMPPSSTSSSPPTVTNSTGSEIRQARFNSSNTIHHAAYEAFYSVPPTESIDICASSPIGGSGDYAYSDLFSPTSTTAAATGPSTFNDSIMFSPTSNRPPSFDMRTASVGDIYNSTSNLSSTLLPLSSSTSASTAIHGSTFSPAHRLSSKHVFEMEHDPSYLSKSTPSNNFFFPPPPPPDGMIHPTTQPSSASSSLPAHQQHYQYYGHHIANYGAGTNTTINSNANNNNSGGSTGPANGLSSVLEESDDVSLTTPPESLMTDKDDYETSSWQQAQQYRSANTDPVNNDLGHRVNGLSISTNPNAAMMKASSGNNLTSPIGTSPAPMMNSNGLLRNYSGPTSNGMMIGSTNPADQNPPCNTLYVGNLPPNTSEDELKQMFSKCVGYKRLSFRHKSNGPMCFVEFADVMCATQALQDLYGNPLSNSVKGGIRLSFSKNPLGVRQQPLGINSNSNATSIFATSPPHSASTMNFGFMNGFPPMNYPRRESMTFDPQLS
ncbi:hypothetical protein [Absidia glauca]|uniref:RRM domain-containing protein n=1 Tax=Absidia glauca TaxID=4829 RepID=A0A168QX02_ABSGL|nr:hypothetical protein [Absidia glauca]